MRSLMMILAVLGGLCMVATQAAAYEIDMAARGATTGLTFSDTVTVDVFLDAEPGLTLLSVGVLYPDDGTLTYDGFSAAALPPSGPGTSGAFPSYILYTAGGSMVPATTLYPNVTGNFWQTWNGVNQPGKFQVNLDWAEGGFNAAAGSGTNIYIGTLVFVVGSGFTSASLDLCVTCGGNTVTIGGSTSPTEVNDQTILGAPITLTPEPTVVSLAAVALGTIAIFRARKRRA